MLPDRKTNHSPPPSLRASTAPLTPLRTTLYDAQGSSVGVYFPKNKVERLLVLACYSAPIKKGFRPAMEKKLIKVFSWWCKKLGLMLMPEGDELNYTAEFLFDFYDELSLKDVSLAVMLSFTEAIKPTERDFGQFSLKYVCSVLNAYRTWRNSALRNVHYEADPAYLAMAEARRREEERAALRRYLMDDFKQSLTSEYKAVHDTGECGSAGNVETVWKFLQAVGAFVATPEQRKAANAWARGIMSGTTAQVPGDALSEMLNNNSYFFRCKTKEEQLKNLCRQHSLKIFFETLDLPAFLSAVDSPESPSPAAATKNPAA